MTETELLKIATDICVFANKKFSNPKLINDKKWVINSENPNSKELIDVPLYFHAILDTISLLKNNTDYIKLIEYLENLDSVKSIVPIAGYHTQPKRLAEKLIENAFISSEKQFNPEKLIKNLYDLQLLISNEYHDFILIGRLHGIKLEVDLIEIESNISLVRLDDNAINERQPLILNSMSDKFHIIDYSNSNVEIKITSLHKITPHGESSYFDVSNKVQSDLRLKLDNVVKAIKLYRHGNYEVYPVSYHSKLHNGMTYSPSVPKHIFENISLNNTDIDGLKKAFSIVKTFIHQDGVLERSFSRFLIGMDESKPEERIVDFVIAWESLLLTVKKNPPQGETSYRFSINGAALLSAIDNSFEFIEMQRFMKGVYTIRSKIVHGEGVGSTSNELKKLKFDSLDVLNNRLSELYQKVIFWLVNLKKEDRPYEADSGWGILLRKTIQ
ncbi:MAG: HEPN domain-containing protein [Methylococcales bacterium]|nr:HEPN domain-containing protein [Methylococcales bacterium]